jgi:hypothetical protein
VAPPTIAAEIASAALKPDLDLEHLCCKANHAVVCLEKPPAPVAEPIAQGQGDQDLKVVRLGPNQ